MPEELEGHYTALISLLQDGEVIPFLGAGANLVDRPEETDWAPGQYLPSASELALHLATRYGYPATEGPMDLVRVAEYVALMVGPAQLYKEMRKIFAVDYPPTQVHEFLARLHPTLAEKGYDSPGLLTVTTNYDDLLERAYQEVGQEFDLVTYMNVGDYKDRFIHIPFDGKEYGTPAVIERPNEHREIRQRPDGNLVRPAILKLHGAVDRFREPPTDSFVITEDHYIDYPAPRQLTDWVPVSLASELSQSNFLFMGYSLRDWNLRVILNRMWQEQPLSYGSWAIQVNPDPLERKFWQRRNVEILDVPLKDYIGDLRTRLEALPSQAGVA